MRIPTGSPHAELGRPVDGQLGPRDLHADQLDLVVAGVDPAPQDDDGVVGEQGTELGHHLGEDEHLDRGPQILEDEGGHQLAPLRVAADEVGDDPPDGADLTVAPPDAVDDDGVRPSFRSAMEHSISRARAPSTPRSGWSLT